MKVRNISSCLAWLCALSAGLNATTERPNIVWLVTEDNSLDYLRLYTEGGAPMPAVERLAAQGLVFDHAFSNAPVCSVARSTLISGTYAPRTLAQFHRRAELVPLPDGQLMFPQYLRQAGYYTTNNAKQDYNFVRGPDVWDASSAKASYRNRAPGQPFFHVQNYGITHEGKLHFTREFMATHATETDPATVPLLPLHPDTPLFRYTNAYYRDLHRQADAEIGDFLAQLEADGVMEDTIIFYYGDHGGVLPGSKGYIQERGLRVPLVVYVPTKWQHLVPATPGSRIDGFVQFVDFGPTVLNLAGLPVPAGMDGRAFLGAGVALDELNSRDTTYSYADRFDEKYDLVRALRQGKFKYLRNYQPFNPDGLQNNYRYQMLAYQEWRDLYRAGQLNADQRQFFEPRPAETLYDVVADPFELHNLATDPTYAEVLTRLRAALQAQERGMPDLSFYPESHLMAVATENPVAFGQAHRAEIARLIAIADLSLQPFAIAKPKLAEALASSDDWKRYWGLIACSSFRRPDPALVAQAKALAAGDGNNLVRTRAAEFLGLISAQDPRPVLIACLQQAKSEEEAALILNTIVLLHDGELGYTFTLDPAWVPADWLKRRTSSVALRYAYLTGKP